MSPRHYILVGHEAMPFEVGNGEPYGFDPEKLIAWADTVGIGTTRALVRFTRQDGVEVSTIFLGLDHAFLGGPPMLFETMVFAGGEIVWQWRCTTWRQAEAIHRVALADVRALQDQAKQVTKAALDALLTQENEDGKPEHDGPDHPGAAGAGGETA